MHGDVLLGLNLDAAGNADHNHNVNCSPIAKFSHTRVGLHREP
jgi:hypothetical protein